MKTDRYNYFLNLMLCIAATDGGDKILSGAFSAPHPHSAKPQEKTKKAFGESVLCVLNKFEA